MNIEEIQKNWDEDSTIDQFDLVSESLKIPKLHAKYYRIFFAEKMVALRLQDDYKIMKLDKFELYTQGPNSETPSEWINREGATSGRLLKADAGMYLEADPDLIKAGQRLQIQTEKLKLVESIINSLTPRGYSIKNSIDMIKFQAGN